MAPPKRRARANTNGSWCDNYIQDHWGSSAYSAMYHIDADAKLQQIWLLYAVVFLLHGIADPVITYLSINVLGIGVELNPLFRGAIEQGAGQFALSHLPLLLIAVFCFAALTLLFQWADAEEREQIYRISVSVLGLCIVWGVLLVGWNLWVLTSGL